MTQNANQGPVLLAVLQERGATRRSWADASVEELSKIAGLDIHDTKKVLHQFQRLGLVRFNTQMSGKARRITAIRLTEKGTIYHYPEARMPSTNGTAAIAERTSPTADVGAPVAASVTGRRRTRATVVAGRAAAMQKRRDEGATTSEVAAEFGVSRRTVTNRTHPPTVATPVVPEPTPEEPTDVFTREVDPASGWGTDPVVDAVWTPLPGDVLAGLDLIRALTGRQERLLSAAAAIEADAPDLAESIVNRAQEAYSPLEREVLTLIARIGPK